MSPGQRGGARKVPRSRDALRVGGDVRRDAPAASRLGNGSRFRVLVATEQLHWVRLPDQKQRIAPGRDWFACGSSTRKPPPRSWHGRRRTASSLPMTGRSFRSRPHSTEKQRLTGKIANEVPCDGKPPSRPHQWRLWHVRFRPRHPSNRSRRPAPCYPRCHCHRTYSGKGDSILVPPKSSAVIREGPFRFG